ncbi:MAG TPA: hypothetical protein PKV92_09010 [Thermodesulfovibrio thiophilus]|nr:hypothetical protein [Thermodesulfovibrio thiophilus]HQD37217.1 hypothetical protein [Thermodesulfovibrio thiophilus]
MKVFIVNKKRNYDYTKAERFGQFVHLTEGKFNLYNIKKIADEMKRKFEEEKASKEDYVLACGHPLLTMIATQYFLNKFGFVQILVWNDISKDYAPVIFYKNDI